MLERVLTELFDQQAAENPPPVRTSVSSAVSQGRSRRRRRTAVGVAAPLLALAVVLAAAVTAGLARQAPVRPAQPGHRGHAIPAGRADGLPLTAMAGWLPPGVTLQSAVISPVASSLVAFGTGGTQDVTMYAKHLCSVRASRLSCPNDNPVVMADPYTLALAGPAPAIHGLPAYWGTDGSEAFQYAADSWAVANFMTRAEDTAVIEHLIFGRSVPPVRYPAQLTGSWPGLGTQLITANFSGGALTAQHWFLGASKPGDASVEIDVYKTKPGFCSAAEPGTPAVINGYRVTTWKSLASATHGIHAPDGSLLCAAADGLDIQIYVTRTHLGVTASSIFARLRLLGPDPRKWTTRPIG